MYICNIIKGGAIKLNDEDKIFFLIQFCSREPETDFFFICVIFGGEQQQLWGKCNLSAKTIHVVL